MGDLSLIPELGKSPGEGNDYPFQYPCPENFRDRRAWWATVHGVPKSWTQLNTNTEEISGERCNRVAVVCLSPLGVKTWEQDVKKPQTCFDVQIPASTALTLSKGGAGSWTKLWERHFLIGHVRGSMQLWFYFWQLRKTAMTRLAQRKARQKIRILMTPLSCQSS